MFCVVSKWIKANQLVGFKWEFEIICRIAADSSLQNEDVAGHDTELEAAPYDEKQSNN